MEYAVSFKLQALCLMRRSEILQAELSQAVKLLITEKKVALHWQFLKKDISGNTFIYINTYIPHPSS